MIAITFCVKSVNNRQITVCVKGYSINLSTPLCPSRCGKVSLSPEIGEVGADTFDGFRDSFAVLITA